MRHPEDMMVKICGVARMEDAVLANSLGADIIGVVLDPRFARHGTPELVSSIHSSGITVAGVYTSMDAILEDHGDEELVQMHFLHNKDDIGKVKEETGKRIISVLFRENGEGSAKMAEERYSAGADIVLIEQANGASSDIEGISRIQKIVRTGVAGKISPDNVALVASTGPLMIDASSSIEAFPGTKDHGLLRSFFRNLEGDNAL